MSPQSFAHPWCVRYSQKPFFDSQHYRSKPDQHCLKNLRCRYHASLLAPTLEATARSLSWDKYILALSLISKREERCIFCRFWPNCSAVCLWDTTAIAARQLRNFRILDSRLCVESVVTATRVYEPNVTPARARSVCLSIGRTIQHTCTAAHGATALDELMRWSQKKLVKVG